MRVITSLVMLLLLTTTNVFAGSHEKMKELSKTQFIEMKVVEGMSAEDAEVTFNELDKDQDGKLSVEEQKQ